MTRLRFGATEDHGTGPSEPQNAPLRLIDFVHRRPQPGESHVRDPLEGGGECGKLCAGGFRRTARQELTGGFRFAGEMPEAGQERQYAVVGGDDPFPFRPQAIRAQFLFPAGRGGGVGSGLAVGNCSTP